MVSIEVVTHFNEDAFSLGLVQGLADRLRKSLEGVRCAEHGEEPSVRLSTEGVAQVVNDIGVEVSGCCEALIERVRQIIHEVHQSTAEAGHEHRTQ